MYARGLESNLSAVRTLDRTPGADGDRLLIG
jgi:hypothetical protein